MKLCYGRRIFQSLNFDSRPLKLDALYSYIKFIFHIDSYIVSAQGEGEGVLHYPVIRGCEGEGEVAFFSAKRWDRRNRADLIESAT